MNYFTCFKLSPSGSVNYSSLYNGLSGLVSETKDFNWLVSNLYEFAKAIANLNISS
jgi:hypothetical protein